MRTHARLLLVAILMASLGHARGEVLENDFVKVTIDPQKGGAVTEIIYKKAVTIPDIAQRGAGSAATGRLFVPQIKVGETALDLATIPMKAQPIRAGDERGLKLTAALDRLAPGLAIERTILLGAQESGLRIADTLRNGGAQAVTLQAGALCAQQPEPWRLATRCWFGDAGRSLWQYTPYNAGSRETIESKSGKAFWRMTSQYAVGLHYQIEWPGPATLTHYLAKDNGNPVEFGWLTAPVPIAPQASVTLAGSVLVDESGIEGNARNASNRVLVSADLRAAGKSGEPMPGFVAVVSAVSRKVKVVVTGTMVDEKKTPEPRSVYEADLVLEPGKGQWRQFECAAPQPGQYTVTAKVLDDKGVELAGSGDRAIIDGESQTGGEFYQVWQKYIRRLPEVNAKGTWAEIGEHLVKQNRGPFKAKKNPPEQAAALMAFHQKKFPYYAELLQGAAKALNVAPEDLLDVNAPAAASGTCMGVFFNGPDGPINAYSKERSGSSIGGLGYCKVIPTKGYPYHLYTLGNWSFGYGVNSEGLCTSGASLNCDQDTEQAGNAATRAWKAAGKPVAPLGVHLMLATCKNVAEALAFIENSEAPFEFTGSMLLVDRAGNSAVLESAGILHQILRPRKDQLVFATGNAPHPRADGRFQWGSGLGWALNTRLRENFLEQILAPRQGQVSLKDVFWIMETHALPGGMCQHRFENAGQLVTSTSYLAVSRTGELYISHGPPCEVRYARYSLKE